MDGITERSKRKRFIILTNYTWQTLESEELRHLRGILYESINCTLLILGNGMRRYFSGRER